MLLQHREFYEKSRKGQKFLDYSISFDYINHIFVLLQREMQRFTEKIVGLMKSENLFESQGGPIILSQV